MRSLYTGSRDSLNPGCVNDVTLWENCITVWDTK